MQIADLKLQNATPCGGLFRLDEVVRLLMQIAEFKMRNSQSVGSVKT